MDRIDFRRVKRVGNQIIALQRAMMKKIKAQNFLLVSGIPSTMQDLSTYAMYVKHEQKYNRNARKHANRMMYGTSKRTGWDHIMRRTSKTIKCMSQFTSSIPGNEHSVMHLDDIGPRGTSILDERLPHPSGVGDMSLLYAMAMNY